MIDISFNLYNPWSDRWACIYDAAGELPMKNKSWEVQFDRCADIIGFDFRWNTRQDHAGLYLKLALFGYDAIFRAYDQRHWDHENRCWEVYEKGIEQ